MQKKSYNKKELKELRPWIEEGVRFLVTMGEAGFIAIGASSLITGLLQNGR
ncbi:MAG: hypothetical protein ACE5DO_04300 [Desulfobacterales bacterium]